MQITNRDVEKISVEQAEYLSGIMEAVGEIIELDVTKYMSVSVQVVGPITGTMVFEISNDGSNWVSKTLVNQAGVSAASATAAGVWTGDIGARFFRVRCSALTAGTPAVHIVALTDSGVNTLATQTVTLGAQVKEDAAVATAADMLLAGGQRVLAAPTSLSSAAGDAILPQFTSEGKALIATFGAEEHLWDACVDLTATTDTLVRAAGAAGIRNVITDITLSNQGAAAVVVTIKDGTTRKYARSVPPGSSVDVQLKSPIRGSAATAVNAALSAAGTVTVSVSGYLGL